jgi:hypothetical protein
MNQLCQTDRSKKSNRRGSEVLVSITNGYWPASAGKTRVRVDDSYDSYDSERVKSQGKRWNGWVPHGAGLAACFHSVPCMCVCADHLARRRISTVWWRWIASQSLQQTSGARRCMQHAAIARASPGGHHRYPAHLRIVAPAPLAQPALHQHPPLLALHLLTPSIDNKAPGR